MFLALMIRTCPSERFRTDFRKNFPEFCNQTRDQSNSQISDSQTVERLTYPQNSVEYCSMSASPRHSVPTRSRQFNGYDLRVNQQEFQQISRKSIRMYSCSVRTYGYFEELMIATFAGCFKISHVRVTYLTFFKFYDIIPLLDSRYRLRSLRQLNFIGFGARFSRLKSSLH